MAALAVESQVRGWRREGGSVQVWVLRPRRDGAPLGDWRDWMGVASTAPRAQNGTLPLQ
jgi:hypothetical protein